MTSQTERSYPSVDDRRAAGEEAAKRTPVTSQAEWAPAADRPDPVELLIEQNTTREPDLVPVRHGRMMVSPFTFYRGAAKVMASDLASTPTAGLEVQLCGDAHLSNFGFFGSPERQLLFGLNDFDETLPGPFEYDLKRMAASFTIAARNNGFSKSDANAVTAESVKAYRTAMADFAAMRTLEVWYAHMSETHLQEAMENLQQEAMIASKPSKRKSGKKRAKAAKSKRPDDATSPRRSRRPRRHSRRRTLATACTPSIGTPSRWTASTASSASPRWWCRCGARGDLGDVGGGDAQHRRGSVPGVPENLE